MHDHCYATQVLSLDVLKPSNAFENAYIVNLNKETMHLSFWIAGPDVEALPNGTLTVMPGYGVVEPGEFATLILEIQSPGVEPREK